MRFLPLVPSTLLPFQTKLNTMVCTVSNLHLSPIMLSLFLLPSNCLSSWLDPWAAFDSDGHFPFLLHSLNLASKAPHALISIFPSYCSFLVFLLLPSQLISIGTQFWNLFSIIRDSRPCWFIQSCDFKYYLCTENSQPDISTLSFYPELIYPTPSHTTMSNKHHKVSVHVKTQILNFLPNLPHLQSSPS